MKFFVKSFGAPTADYNALKSSTDRALLACKKYNEHLQQIAAKLPPETSAFVLARWYSDPTSHESPHDAWLKEFKINTNIGAQKYVHVTLTLLRSYHDRLLTFEYKNVTECNCEIITHGAKNVGDWLRDEFDVLDSGFVSHAILWQHGNPWKIVAERISFKSDCLPLDHSAEKGGGH